LGLVGLFRRGRDRAVDEPAMVSTWPAAVPIGPDHAPAPWRAESLCAEALCAEALWAGTLALMTRYAEPDSAPLRPAIARKVACNLEQLARHPDLARPLGCVVRRSQARWVALTGAAPSS
jgi:hypothetical protein